MTTATILLALTAGMLAAANPCGFAMLPAYLSVLVGDAEETESRVGGVLRALSSTAAMTVGFVVVFGTFGLAMAPAASWLQPRLPWLTLALGVVLVILGGWVAAGRPLPAVRGGARAPKLTGSVTSMVLFGVAYALASLSCTIAPFLAIVVSSLRAGSTVEGLVLFVAYAVGMGLVVGVTALAVALVRTSLIRGLRRAATAISRASGVLLALAGAYVAYYGWYEIRVAADLRNAGGDPVVGAATGVQQRLSTLLTEIGVGSMAAIFGVLFVGALVIGTAQSRRSSRSL